MKLADTTLLTLQTKDIFVDVFTDRFDESLYGFIRDFNDKYLLLEQYNDDGFYNGIVIYRREDITRIKWDNNAIKSAFRLITRHKQTEDFANIKIDSLESIVKSVGDTYNYINLMLQDIESDWSIIGQVLEMDANTIVIKEYGTMATLDRGMLMISTVDVTRIAAGGIYENNLMKIHKQTNSTNIG